jgi:hypothetical protein
MRSRHMTPKDYAKAVGVGLATGVILAVASVLASKTGISPLPKPLGLAFARVLLGDVPLPVGLVFHLVYVTFWSVVYVRFFDRLTFPRALGLALALWVLVLVLFFPVVGWGFFGLEVSPALIVAALASHVAFAVILWGLCRWAFGPAD